MSKVKNILSTVLCALFIFGLPIWGLILPDKFLSESERRKLENFPEISMDTISSGEFMVNFEKYTQDHFPLRDTFRNIKALTAYYPMMQKDNNGFYNVDGYIVKMDYPMNTESIINATDKFRTIYDTFLKSKDVNIYLSIIPDKNYFAAEKGYLSMDYDKFTETVRSQMDYAEYIDIFPTLELSDYYKTDTHWKQEEIVDTAKLLAEGMGVTLDDTYETVKADTPFYGVYYGQAALTHISADSLCYLTNDTLENCVVTDLELNQKLPVYDMSKLTSDDPTKVADPYEMFLSGPNRSILTITNPNATTDKELIIIRDSYANALAPLLFEGYKKITLVDIRKVPADRVGRFVPIKGQDILFLQSTLVLNNSSEFK